MNSFVFISRDITGERNNDENIRVAERVKKYLEKSIFGNIDEDKDVDAKISLEEFERNLRANMTKCRNNKFYIKKVGDHRILLFSKNVEVSLKKEDLDNDENKIELYYRMYPDGKIKIIIIKEICMRGSRNYSVMTDICIGEENINILEDINSAKESIKQEIISEINNRIKIINYNSRLLKFLRREEIVEYFGTLGRVEETKLWVKNYKKILKNKNITEEDRRNIFKVIYKQIQELDEGQRIIPVNRQYNRNIGIDIDISNKDIYKIKLKNIGLLNDEGRLDIDSQENEKESGDENEKVFKAYDLSLFWLNEDMAYQYWNKYIVTEKDEMDKNRIVSLNLSEEEIDIIQKSQPPFYINGRAGTGKSTMLYYLFVQYLFIYLIKLNDFSDKNKKLKPPLFLTYTKRLKENAIESIAILLVSTLYRYFHAERDLNIQNEDFNKYLLEDNIGTWDSFLRGEIEGLNKMKELLEKYMEDNFIFMMEEFIKSKFNWDKKDENKITFDVFKNKNRTLFNQQRIDDHKYWSVIRSIIKGINTEDIKSFNDIPRRDRIGIESEENFQEIVGFYNNQYRKWLREDNKWDYLDMIRYALKKQEEQATSLYSAIFVDEAQDFTQLDIRFILSLFQFVHYAYNIGNNEMEKLSFPIVLAGDPLQTINPTGFSWRRLRSVFHDIVNGEYNISNGGNIEIEEKLLSTNYRSSKEIVSLSNAILEYRKNKIGTNDERIAQEKCAGGDNNENDDQQKKIFIIKNRENKDILCENLDNIDIIAPRKIIKNKKQKCMENSTNKEKGQQEENDNKIVLTPMQSKGLEFNNVLIYDFGTAYWEDIKKENTHYIKLKHIFSEIYVAVTRARKKLYIWETDGGALDMWMWNDIKQNALNEGNNTQYEEITLENFKDELNMKPKQKEDLALSSFMSAEIKKDTDRELAIQFYKRARRLYSDLGKEKEANKCSLYIGRLEGKYFEAAEAYFNRNNELKNDLDRDIKQIISDTLFKAYTLENENRNKIIAKRFQSLWPEQSNKPIISFYQSFAKFILSNEYEEKASLLLIMNITNDNKNYFRKNIVLEAIKRFLKQYIKNANDLESLMKLGNKFKEIVKMINLDTEENKKIYTRMWLEYALEKKNIGYLEEIVRSISMNIQELDLRKILRKARVYKQVIENDFDKIEWEGLRNDLRTDTGEFVYKYIYGEVKNNDNILSMMGEIKKDIYKYMRGNLKDQQKAIEFIFKQKMIVSIYKEIENSNNKEYLKRLFDESWYKEKVSIPISYNNIWNIIYANKDDFKDYKKIILINIIKRLEKIIKEKGEIGTIIEKNIEIIREIVVSYEDSFRNISDRDKTEYYKEIDRVLKIIEDKKMNGEYEGRESIFENIQNLFIQLKKYMQIRGEALRLVELENDLRNGNFDNKDEIFEIIRFISDLPEAYNNLEVVKEIFRMLKWRMFVKGEWYRDKDENCFIAESDNKKIYIYIGDWQETNDAYQDKIKRIGKKPIGNRDEYYVFTPDAKRFEWISSNELEKHEINLTGKLSYNHLKEISKFIENLRK